MAQGRRRIPQSGPLCDALFITGNRRRAEAAGRRLGWRHRSGGAKAN